MLEISVLRNEQRLMGGSRRSMTKTGLALIWTLKLDETILEIQRQAI